MGGFRPGDKHTEPLNAVLFIAVSLCLEIPISFWSKYEQIFEAMWKWDSIDSYNSLLLWITVSRETYAALLKKGWLVFIINCMRCEVANREVFCKIQFALQYTYL